MPSNADKLKQELDVAWVMYEDTVATGGTKLQREWAFGRWLQLEARHNTAAAAEAAARKASPGKAAA